FIEFRKSGKFLVVSRPMQNWLNKRCKGSLNNSALIRNGVDLNVFRPLPSSNHSKFIVGYAGGFVGWQGVDNLVKAVSQTSNRNIELHLIGLQASDRELASKFKSQLGDRLQLFDRMSQDDLVKTLANADVLAIPRQAHPALRVALPTKFAEYLAIGKPVIVSNVDETADLIHQYDCGLVAEPSIESWTTTLDNAAQLSLTEKTDMGARGRELAESEFAWNRIGENYAHWLHRWSA
ncbi:glycosyltransferase, partial [Mariniblastus sp.]|nr:glycosyltransferase [Mariniblastus sp.]